MLAALAGRIYDATPQQNADPLGRTNVPVSGKEIEASIHGVLKPLGYRKSGLTWRRDREHVVSVVSLQKSQWGDDFYLNAGVYLKDEAAAQAPTADACHIWWRPSVGNGGALTGSVADIELVLRHLALPWLDKLVDRPTIGDFLASPEAEGVAIRLSAREWASRGS